MPSLSDLRNLFYGGGSAAEYAFLQSAEASGLTSAKLLTAPYRFQEIELLVDTASIDFQNIPATHRNIKLSGSLRTTQAATAEFVNLALNNDTTAANYEYEQVSALGAVASAFYGSNNRSVAYVTGATATADQFASWDCEIMNYKGNKRKTLEWASGVPSTADTAFTIVNAATLWKSTAVVNRVTITPTGGGNFVTGSVVSLYLYP